MSYESAAGRPVPRRILLWVALAGVLIRFLYLTDHMGSSFFGVPILDEAFYDTVARALLAGDPVAAIDPGFRPLLYPAFLALAYAIGGPADAVIAVGLQHLLGVVTALVVAGLAWRLSGSRAASLSAGLLYVLAGPPLFFEGERLVTTLFTFLVTASLWSLVRADEAEREAGWWLAGGALAALATQARPNALVFLGLSLAVGAWRALRRSERARGPLIWAPLGFVGVVFLALLVQAPFLGGLHFPGGSGGINFYLGNERGADGMTPVQDRAVVVGEAYRDSVEVFAREELERQVGWSSSEAPSARAVSAYWLRRGLDEIVADPTGWLRLMGRKALLLLWNEEIPNNKSYRFVVEEESWVLHWMPVRWWLLLALAPLGAVAVLRRRPRGGIWLPGFLGIYGASLLLFFVTSRFRIPLWPSMAALAGLGSLELVAAFGRGRRSWGPRLAVAVGLGLLSVVPWTGAELPGYARDHLFRSIAAREKGLDELAVRDARRASELAPGDPAAWIQLGVVEQDRGRFEAALAAYARAAELAPEEPRPLNNAGVILEEKGRVGEAYRLYRRALENLPDYGPALVNAALLELRAGRVDLAAQHVDRSAASGYRSPSAEVAAALVARREGREQEARERLRTVGSRHPELVRRLLAEQESLLDPAALGL